METIAHETSLWPPADGLTTPTCSRHDAVLTLSASIVIEAPASAVFSYVRDTSTYPSWCTFVPLVTIKSQPPGIAATSSVLEVGTAFTYHVVMNSAKPHSRTPTHLCVTDVSTPDNPSSYIPQSTLDADASFTADLGSVYRIAWRSEMGSLMGLLRTERFHEVLVMGEGTCCVRTWEVMGGVAANAVKWLYSATLQAKFREWCADLKKVAEKATVNV